MTDPETDHALTFTLKLAFFGRRRQIPDFADHLKRVLQLHYGDDVEIEEERIPS